MITEKGMDVEKYNVWKGRKKSLEHYREVTKNKVMTRALDMATETLLVFIHEMLFSKNSLLFIFIIFVCTHIFVYIYVTKYSYPYSVKQKHLF